MPNWSVRSDSAANAYWRLLVRLALVAGVLYAGYRLRGILVTLAVAAVIAYMLDPLVEWLVMRPAFVSAHNRLAGLFPASTARGDRALRITRPSHPRVSRHALRLFATVYVFIASVLVMWQVGKLIVTPFVDEVHFALSPAGRAQALRNKEKLVGWYNEHAPDWARSEKLADQVKQSSFMRAAQGAAAQAATRVLESLGNVVELLLLPVLAFYFLIDGRRLKHEFVALVPRAWLGETMRMLREFNRIMRAFIVGQFLLCLLAGIVVGTGLALLHVQYPIILGVFAGLTRAIPIIGPIVGGIPIVVLTLVTKGPTVALAVLAFFTLLHFAESKFVMPVLIGDRMDLHPVIIIVVLLVGGEIGGLAVGSQLGALLGMFFAAPLAAIVRVMVRRYWLGIRRGPSPGPAAGRIVPTLPPARLVVVKSEE